MQISEHIYRTIFLLLSSWKIVFTGRSDNFLPFDKFMVISFLLENICKVKIDTFAQICPLRCYDTLKFFDGFI